jgi:hypothetical protein
MIAYTQALEAERDYLRKALEHIEDACRGTAAAVLARAALRESPMLRDGWAGPGMLGGRRP